MTKCVLCNAYTEVKKQLSTNHMIQKTTCVLCEVRTEAEETYEHEAYNTA